jgi:stringent starvation protein B
MKDVGMSIRVEPELRGQFISLCHEHNVPAAQVLRLFTRDFVQGVMLARATKKHASNLQSKVLHS